MRGNGFKCHDRDMLAKWSEKIRLQFNKLENKHCTYMKKEQNTKRKRKHKGERKIEAPKERIEICYE